MTIRFDSPARRSSLLVEHARCSPGDRILDLSLYGRVGHGDVPVAIDLKRAYPESEVVGLYADRPIVESARRRVADAQLAIEIHEGDPTTPRFPNGSFDRVVASLLLHHLEPREKRLALARIHDVLTDGGELLVLDFTESANPLLRVTFLVVRLGDGLAATADHVAGRLPTLIEEAGFSPVVEVLREVALPGVLALHRATKSSPSFPAPSG